MTIESFFVAILLWEVVHAPSDQFLPHVGGNFQLISTE